MKSGMCKWHVNKTIVAWFDHKFIPFKLTLLEDLPNELILSIVVRRVIVVRQGLFKLGRLISPSVLPGLRRGLPG